SSLVLRGVAGAEKDCSPCRGSLSVDTHSVKMHPPSQDLPRPIAAASFRPPRAQGRTPWLRRAASRGAESGGPCDGFSIGRVWGAPLGAVNAPGQTAGAWHWAYSTGRIVRDRIDRRQDRRREDRSRFAAKPRRAADGVRGVSDEYPTVSELMERATNQSGLEDFGPPS